MVYKCVFKTKYTPTSQFSNVEAKEKMLIKNSEQNTFSPNFKCDYCDENPAPNIKGYAAVAQGYSGRWCEVMWMCDSCGDERVNDGAQALHVTEARERINSKPAPNRVDF